MPRRIAEWYWLMPVPYPQVFLESLFIYSLAYIFRSDTDILPSRALWKPIML